MNNEMFGCGFILLAIAVWCLLGFECGVATAGAGFVIDGLLQWLKEYKKIGPDGMPVEEAE